MANNVLNVLVGVALIKTGTAGLIATTDVGYTVDGAELKTNWEGQSIDVDQSVWPLKEAIKNGSLELVFNFAEATLANFDLTMNGASVADGVLTLAEPADTSETISVRLSQAFAAVSPRPAYTRTWDIPYMAKAGTLSVGYKKGGLQIIQATFRVIKYGSVVPVRLADIVDVTIASGTFTRTAGTYVYRMAGEGGAADALTDITGASLTNLEYIEIIPLSAAQPITVTHASGVIELTGSTNWVMTDVRDRLILQYNTSGSKWVEISRVDN
jgi:3D (Asp-Asp-Asp) domain-containing protein